MRRRKKRSIRGGTEREVRRGRHYTNGREEHCERSTRACTGSRRGRRAEPQLVPTSSQTNASFARRRNRAFCGARSSLHLRTDPLTRCHRQRFAPLVRSLAHSPARIADLYADAPAGIAAPVIIAARGGRVARPI